MKTVTIQIGNTDNKLSQQDWAEFVQATHDVIHDGLEVHFYAPSPGDAKWQNACWVCVAEDAQIKTLTARLAPLCRDYEQDSIAVTIGETKFIGAK